MNLPPHDEVTRVPDPNRRAVARVVIIVALVGVTGIIAAQLGVFSSHRSAAAGRPAVRLAPFVVKAPPALTSLIWLSTETDQVPDAVRLRAFDWSGRQVGAEAFRCAAPCSFDASPDGQRLVVYEVPALQQPLTYAVVFDSAGRVLGPVGDPIWHWADDRRDLCTLHGAALNTVPDATAAAELDLIEPATGGRKVIAHLTAPRPAASPSSSWQVAACSTLADQAVVTVEDQAGIHAVRAIALSTGRSVYSSASPFDPQCACAVASLQTSHDGSVVVETSATGSSQLVDIRTGAVTSLHIPSGSAQAYDCCSWSGHRMVALNRRNGGGVAEILSGVLTWQAPLHSAATTIIAVRPGTDDLAIALWTPEGVGQVVIVDAAGHATYLSSMLPMP